MDSRVEVVIQRESLGETIKCDTGSQWTYCTMKRLKLKDSYPQKVFKFGQEPKFL